MGQNEIYPLIPTLAFDEKINCGPIYCYPTFGKRKVILEDLYVGPSDKIWKYKGFALKLWTRQRFAEEESWNMSFLCDRSDVEIRSVECRNVGNRGKGKEIGNDELPFISQSVNVMTRKQRADEFPELNLTKKHRGIHEAMKELRSESFPEEKMYHDLLSDQDGEDDNKEEVDIELSQEGDFAAHYCFEKHYSPEEKEYAKNVSENLILEKLLDKIIGLVQASAHRSVAGTLRQLKSLNLTFHPNHGESVEKLISNCKSCRFGKLKGDMKPDEKLPVGDAPFVVAADIFHFHVSEKQYVGLIIADHFTRFTQTYLLKKRTSNELISCFRQWIGSFGYFLTILTDNVKEFMKEMHVEHLRRGVARSKANAIVERKIRDVEGIFENKISRFPTEECVKISTRSHGRNQYFSHGIWVISSRAIVSRTLDISRNHR